MRLSPWAPAAIDGAVASRRPARDGTRVSLYAGLVAVLALVAAGCGGNEDDIPVTYRVVAPDNARVSPEVLGVLRGRLAAAGVEGAGVSATGNDVVVSAASGDPATRATIAALTVAGNVAIYDWEAHVVGPDGHPGPADAKVTGGPAAGDEASAISRYDAVLRAARAPADTAAQGTTTYWLVDDKSRRVLRGPASTRGQLARGTRPARTRVVAVAPGRVIVRADGNANDRWYVLEDVPAMTGADIDTARPARDEIVDEPTVLMTFTPRGQRSFKKLTRELAVRGRKAGRAGAPDVEAHQHFAIVLDDRIIATPYIDHRQNPEGIDAAVGSQISGGLTAREAARVAGLIGSGPLPEQLVPSEK